MPWWPPDAWFFIVGAGSDGYVETLRRLASSVGAAERVVFLVRVPYDEIVSYAVGVTVGILMLDTSKPNWHFAAGASNKRFEYMALRYPSGEDEQCAA